jgi:hypothetical protein
MTTGWGADCDPAPRLAYELAAAVADGDGEFAANIWGKLDGPGRAGVVAALGAQARHAAHRAGGQNARAVLAEQALDLLAELQDCRARDAALRSLEGRPAAFLPPCDGCASPALALVRVRLRVMAAGGLDAATAAELSRIAARR